MLFYMLYFVIIRIDESIRTVNDPSQLKKDPALVLLEILDIKFLLDLNLLLMITTKLKVERNETKQSKMKWNKTKQMNFLDAIMNYY